MAAEFPKSYKDPLYAELDAKTERKLGLPSGLLAAIRTRGERSNADQVSEANAETPYQFIPSTRRAIVDKYGIDPMLSPSNASEAAGLLLKESLDRNKGDAASAVAEYHGGVNRKNWGPRTTAYVKRVVGAEPKQVTPSAMPSATVNLPVTSGPSMFERAQAQRKESQPPAESIAKVYAAYKAGQMTPEDAAAFEADVSSGALMLPAGAEVKNQAPANMLPAGVVDAYAAGKMRPEEEAALIEDVRAGLVTLPPGRSLDRGGASAIPGAGGAVAPAATRPTVSAAPQGIVQNIIGAGETALTLGTGAVGAPVGALMGVGKTIAQAAQGQPTTGEQNITQGMQALTYQPRTVAAQQNLETIGGYAQNLPPVIGVAATPAMMAPLAGAVAPARAAVGAAVQPVRQAVAEGAGRITDRIRQIRGVPVEKDALAQRGSVGAAETSAEAQRVAVAESLPVPIEMTRGAASRDSSQLAFEKEAMKSAEFGGKLRARAEKNNLQVLQNFERMVDQTGAESPDIAATGRSVTDALTKSAARDKAEIRTAYKSAEKQGELAEPVPTETLVQYLNENISGESTAPTLGVVKNELVRLGGATLNDDGTLNPGVLKLNDFEQVRKVVNKFVKDDSNDQRVAAEIRVAHDLATEGIGGDAYRKARAARIKYADKYENRAIVANLLTNRKGMKDPKVAIDQVFNKTVLQGAPEELKFIEGILKSGGPEGQQAWAELQGATIQHIRDAATSGLGMDSAGNRIVSTAKLNQAVNQLDRNGRLDIVLGKQQAQTMRDMNETLQYVTTVPPGTLVNQSGTAGMLLAAIGETGALSMVGLPLPVLTIMKFASGKMKDRKMQQRVDQALRAKPAEAAPKPKF
jgi:hypothetical protein